MTLAEALDELFCVPLSEFIAKRTVLAAAAKSDGDAGLAKAIQKTRKPSVSAWAVNQLYFQNREQFEKLDALVDKIKAGHEGQLTAEELQQTMEARTETIGALVEAAHSVLEGDGHAASSGTLEKIKRTLEAHALPGEDDERIGWLTRDLEPKGFGALGGLSLQPPKKSAPAAEPEPEPEEEEPEDEGETETVTARPPDTRAQQRAAIEKAEARCARIEEQATEVTSELERVRARTVELEQQAQTLLNELERARKALREAQAALAED